MKRILFLLLTFALFSCSVKKSNDIIRVSVGAEPQSIDPSFLSAIDSMIYAIHTFEGLTTKDKNNNIIGGVAKDWEISEDGLTIIFHLRDNAKWSDGKKVTAEDFLYSFRRAVNPETASPMSYLMEYIKNAKDITRGLKPVQSLGVIAADENTLIIELEAPTLYFLDIVASGGAYVPVREDIIETYGDDWTWNPETYIGNGAYKMVERKPDELIAFEINTNYWDYKSQVAKRINFVLMADEYIALNSVRTGDVDFSITAPPIGEIENLIKDGLMAVSDIIGCYYIDVNTKDKALSDKRVRKALSLAIDRNYIIQNIGVGLLFSIAGFGCSIAASCSIFMLAYHLYDYLITLQVFRIIRKWIRPIIGGLLMKIMVMLCLQNIGMVMTFMK